MKHPKPKIRLLQQTSRSFLRISFLLIAISSLVLFFYVRELLQHEVEEELYSTTARIENALKMNKKPYQMPPVVEIETVETLGVEALNDTLIYDPSQSEMEEFRELTTFRTIHGTHYRITVRNLIVESEDILLGIILSYIGILFLVFMLLFYWNNTRNKQTWLPFFFNLEKMKAFSLSDQEKLSLMESDILEFTELKNEKEMLTTKVKTDYLNLKQYTENVSHELQTPLALIKAKIETLINGDQLEKDQFEVLTSIQQDIYKLTHLNKRLSLLTKIENNQFAKTEWVSLSKVLTKLTQNFEEISSAEIQHSFKTELSTQMDPYLAEVLCQNLLSNAIKYTTKGKPIIIAGTTNKLAISDRSKINCLNEFT